MGHKPNARNDFDGTPEGLARMAEIVLEYQ